MSCLAKAKGGQVQPGVKPYGRGGRGCGCGKEERGEKAHMPMKKCGGAVKKGGK